MELHCDGVHIKVEEDRTSRRKDHRLENKTLDSFWNNQSIRMMVWRSVA